MTILLLTNAGVWGYTVGIRLKRGVLAPLVIKKYLIRRVMMKKILAIVISMAMIVAMIPQMAFAADSTLTITASTSSGEIAGISISDKDGTVTAWVNSDRKLDVLSAESLTVKSKGNLTGLGLDSVDASVNYGYNSTVVGLLSGLFYTIQKSADGNVTVNVFGESVTYSVVKSDAEDKKFNYTATLKNTASWASLRKALISAVTKSDTTNISVKSESESESSSYTFAANSLAIPGYAFNKTTAVSMSGSTISLVDKSVTPSPSPTPTPATNDEVKTDTNASKTETTVKDTKTETVKNESGQEVTKTTATVSETTAQKLVEQAVANNSETVEVTVKSGAAATDEVSTEVAIPKTAVDSIASNTSASLVVKTDNSEIALDNKALETISSAATGETVTLAVDENTQLAADQKAAAEVVGDSGMVIELSVLVGNTKIHDFKGGEATVKVPVPEKLKGKDIVAMYINEKGICKMLKHSIETAGTDNFVKFTTTHFSTFAIVEKAGAEKLVADQADSLIKDLKLTVKTSKTSAKSIKAVVSGDVSALTDAGYTVEYKFFRSTKKASKYVGKTDIRDSVKYVNTAGTKGTRYYYKARAYVYDGDTLVGKTALTQCKYGCRIWTK